MDSAAMILTRQLVHGSVRRSPPASHPRACGLVAPVRLSKRSCRALSDRNRVLYTDSTIEPAEDFETVGDVMTREVLTVFTETPVIEALRMVVDKRITGLPVVDQTHKVVGVVSDFDLLALDRVSLQEDKSNLFPPIHQSWQAFNEVRRLIQKAEGQNVGDVMTAEPLVVRSETSLDAAAKILLESKIRRLPVVDKDGSLVGLLTRRDVVKAALRSMNEK